MPLSWVEQAANADAILLSVFGEDIVAVLHPKGSQEDVPLSDPNDGSSLAAPLAPLSVNREDNITGYNTDVVRLFVRYDAITPRPQGGDKVTLNGVLYNCFDVKVDTDGGAIMQLRKAK